MANVISSFLVGIGFDYDKKGAKEIDSSIGHIKSTALQAGAAIAGAFGIKSLTADFADANDRLGKFSEVFGVIPNDVAAMGRALEHEGGTLASFMSQLEGIERLRAGLLTGDAGFIAQAGIAGIDPSAITSAKDATAAYAALSNQFSRMSTQKRLNAAEALGLDEASIRLLSRGRAEFDKAVDIEKSLRPLTMEMTKVSAEFNDVWQDMWTRIGGSADRASMQILPAVNDIIKGMNGWYDENEKIINQGVDKTFAVIGDNLVSLSVAGGLVTASGVLSVFAGMAKHIPFIGKGLPAIVAGMSKLSLLAAGFAGFQVGSVISENLSDETNNDIGRGIAQMLAFFGNDEAQRSLAMEKAANPTVITPSSAASANNGIPYNDYIQKQADLFPKYSGQQSKQITLQPIVIQLDGRPFRDMIIDITDEQAEQTLDDMKSPFKG